MPCREDTVTLPVPSVYMMNMLVPAICVEPTPSATHEYVVGALSCRYIFPVVEDAEVLGTPTPKHTSVAPVAQVLAAAALAVVAAVENLVSECNSIKRGQTLYFLLLTQ